MLFLIPSKKILSSSVCLLVSTFFLTAVSLPKSAIKDSDYSDIFMSYISPADVAGMVDYAKDSTHQLGGVMMWEISGDTPYDASASNPVSLLGMANKTYNVSSQATNPPQIMSYWTDWSVYTAQALPLGSYPIPGSLNSSTGEAVSNADLTAKLAGLNVLAYAFLEAQAKTYNGKTNTTYGTQGGTLYFNDPWSDLKTGDDFCTNNPNICYFTAYQKGVDPTKQTVTSMGNFEAFAGLKHASASNPLGPLQKIISIGGYGHNDTFEDTFSNSNDINNFVNSAAAIVNDYGISGVDLDYEDPAMTHAQSDDFASLVSALRAKLPNAIIDVTILANPAYIDGTLDNNTEGFDKNALATIETAIASQAQSHINLMTYDFHGAFDYPGNTGFLTNLYLPNDDPNTADFSVDAAVSALYQQGVPYKEIVIGIPSYSRAIAGVSEGNTGGLFQAIGNTALVPAGNFDAAGCVETIANPTCSGTFAYKYIVDKMLGHNFTATTHQDATGHQGVANGTTAYAASWAPALKPDYTLTIKNLSAAPGITINVDDGAFVSDYVAPGANKTYDNASNPSTSGIEGGAGLQITYSSYTGGPQGTCASAWNFSQNSTITFSGPAGGPYSCGVTATS